MSRGNRYLCLYFGHSYTKAKGRPSAVKIKLQPFPALVTFQFLEIILVGARRLEASITFGVTPTLNIKAGMPVFLACKLLLPRQMTSTHSVSLFQIPYTLSRNDVLQSNIETEYLIPYQICKKCGQWF